MEGGSFDDIRINQTPLRSAQSLRKLLFEDGQQTNPPGMRHSLGARSSRTELEILWPVPFLHILMELKNVYRTRRLMNPRGSHFYKHLRRI